MHYIIGFFIFLLTLVLNVLIPVAISSIILFIFDFIFGTTYLAPSYIGALALLIWVTGRVNK